jgi:hypothetical protein
MALHIFMRPVSPRKAPGPGHDQNPEMLFFDPRLRPGIKNSLKGSFFAGLRLVAEALFFALQRVIIKILLYPDNWVRC